LTCVDPFGTAELRRRVLDTWRQSPARFRADANVEDDLALTGYRDRVVVELAQNAADAATRAGIDGRLVLALDNRTLTASNTGAPLDAAGVESISVARASAKLDEVDTVGRFGVGFAAVLAVTDEPAIVSTSRGVRWSRSDALAIVSENPELAGEVESRGDRVPVLRLPFSADDDIVIDGDTAVVLPLRDDDSVEAVRAQLAELDPTLLLALPALNEIVIRLDGREHMLRAERSGQTVRLHDGMTSSRWHLAAGSGPLPVELLADRPIEEQRHDTWQVTWAIPVDDTGRVAALPDSVPGVIRAPTAVDDTLTLPAVVIASYPLDSNRRRVTPSPLADAVTAHAAHVLTDAIVDLPAHPSVLRLLPTGLPNGEVDGALHAAVLERLADARWLPLASDEDMRQRPREAVIVADELVEVLRDVVPAVLPAGWSRPELVGLGVRRPEVAELVDELGAVHQPPQWWWRLYAALDATIPAGPDRDALGALPVPLVDGTMVTGPRGLALPDAEASYGDLSALGIRMVHPQAAHPLLRTLGAVEGAARDLLEQPQVSAAVAASYDEDDPAPIASAVLSLLAMTGVGADELPWLSDLALTDAAGEWRPAGELLLPDGRMASSIASDSAFGVVEQDWLSQYGREAVAAAGVLAGPAVLRDTDVVGPTHDLDDEESWWLTLPRDSAVEEFVAIRDLEQVRDGALADLLEDLALPPLRSAVVDPAIVTLVDGSRLRVPSYTAWWLSSRPIVGGYAPRELCLPGGDPRLEPLYDVAARRGVLASARSSRLAR
jgi:hypothetical protein